MEQTPNASERSGKRVRMGLHLRACPVSSPPEGVGVPSRRRRPREAQGFSREKSTCDGGFVGTTGENQRTRPRTRKHAGKRPELARNPWKKLPFSPPAWGMGVSAGRAGNGRGRSKWGVKKLEKFCGDYRGKSKYPLACKKSGIFRAKIRADRWNRWPPGGGCLGRQNPWYPPAKGRGSHRDTGQERRAQRLDFSGHSATRETASAQHERRHAVGVTGGTGMTGNKIPLGRAEDVRQTRKNAGCC